MYPTKCNTRESRAGVPNKPRKVLFPDGDPGAAICTKNGATLVRTSLTLEKFIHWDKQLIRGGTMQKCKLMSYHDACTFRTSLQT